MQIYFTLNIPSMLSFSLYRIGQTGRNQRPFQFLRVVIIYHKITACMLPVIVVLQQHVSLKYFGTGLGQG